MMNSLEERLDAIGNVVNEGDAVCVLTAGNFIYGHVNEVKNLKAEVIPDIGYRTSKKNFRLKDKYISRLDHLVKFNPEGFSVNNSTNNNNRDIQDESQALDE